MFVVYTSNTILLDSEFFVQCLFENDETKILKIPEFDHFSELLLVCTWNISFAYVSDYAL